MKLSCIVSTYNRPHVLQACLHCLNLQTEKDWECIITDNSTSEEMVSKNRWVVDQMDERFAYLNTKQEEPYSSAEMGVRVAQGTWLAFASDDCYYTPQFAEIMLATAMKRDLDFVYSDGVYSRPGGIPVFFNTQPRMNQIDKISFIMKREIFTKFPEKAKVSCSDGLLIESLVKSGYRHAKAAGCLWVHS